MNVCFVADLRSPIARGWITSVQAAGHDVSVISSYPYLPQHRVAENSTTFDIGLSHWKERSRQRLAHTDIQRRRLFSRAAALAKSARAAVGPFLIRRAAPRLAQEIRARRPDLVHALRIPYEGIAAAAALQNTELPLVVSVWGNDLTLFAERYPALGRATVSALRRATGLHADCARDIALSASWGFSLDKPTLVAPGAGGLAPAFIRAVPGDALRQRLNIPAGVPVVFHPRGVRSYVRNDTFFAAVPLVLERLPGAIFVLVGMKNDVTVEKWVAGTRWEPSLRVLGQVSQDEMAGLFAISDVFVSITDHDGTPNTLLEGMAAGALPVAGDLASVREWITHGENGLLCQPGDPVTLAGLIVRAVGDEPWRDAAARRNRALTAGLSREAVSASIDTFYTNVLGQD